RNLLDERPASRDRAPLGIRLFGRTTDHTFGGDSSSSPTIFAPFCYASLLEPLPVAMREVSSVLKPHVKEPQDWIGIITLGLLGRFAEQIQGGVGCPDGPVGHKPYAVLAQAMHQAHRHAIARVVLHHREQVVLLRPVERLLVLSVLHHDQQITRPASFQEELPALEVAAEELHLARTLIDASTNTTFDLSRYPDAYTDQLRRLIEAKAAVQ